MTSQFGIISLERRPVEMNDPLGRANVYDGLVFLAEARREVDALGAMYFVYFLDANGLEVSTPRPLELTGTIGSGSLYKPGVRVQGTIMLPPPDELQRITSIQIRPL